MTDNPMFGDMFGGLFGPQTTPTPPAAKKTEKGVPWEAKVINGEYYVPLRQVNELLGINEVLPAVRRGIAARIEAKKKES